MPREPYLEGRQMVKVVEEYIVSILGVEDKPLPSVWHLQKEFFILTRMNPNVQKLLNFVSHYEGPYSQILQESYKEPMCYEEAFETDKNDEITLTKQGKKTFDEIKKKYSDNPKFTQFLQSLKLVREIYDKLSKEELLFLMYLTYPSFKEYSNIYERLVKNVARRKRICDNLLKKGVITLDRYEELISLATQ
jgi:hypothetical protein